MRYDLLFALSVFLVNALGELWGLIGLHGSKVLNEF